MRFKVFGVGLAMLGYAIGGSAVTQLKLDGMWSATSDAQGSVLAMVLDTKGAAVSGTGRYTVGAIRTGAVTVSGSYQSPLAKLQLAFDNGQRVQFVGTVIDSERMTGSLSYQDGSTVPIEFVRP